MIIQKISVTNIKPAVYNPRKDLQPTDKEYLKLAKSMKEFDLVEPLVWNKRSGNLVGGHQRLKILKDIGQTEVEVSVVDLTDAKEKALNLALNKISGEWDNVLLKDLLQEIDTGDFDIEITGFDSKEIEDLMNQTFVPTEGLTDDDAIPDAVEAKTKRGDLYKLGNHRLLCGDATVITDVEKLMQGEKADIILTDPPYGINLDTDWTNLKGSDKGKIEFKKMGGGNKYKQVIGDDVDFDPSFILASFDYCKEIFLWGADYYIQQLPTGGNLIIWDKRLTESADLMIGSPFEVLWSKFRHRKEIIRQKWAGIYGLSSQDVKHRIHPTQKPVEVNTWVLDKYTKVECICLDLFGGSGSTLIACEKLNRKCRMMEIDEHYCDVIIKRYEDFTGKTAELING